MDGIPYNWNNLVGMVVLGVALAEILLYLSRNQTHATLRSAGRLVQGAMRLASRSVLLAAQRLRERNREVLLAAGADAVERELEREFHRVDAVVSRDVQGYPALHRQMVELVEELDEDYRQSTEAAPAPPAWTAAVQALAKLPDKANPVLAEVFGQIHATADRQHKAAIEAYRSATATRHRLLRRMMPHWRHLSKTLEDVGRTLTGLQERSKVIDAKMAEYMEIRAGSDRAVRTLSSSSMTQFFVAGLVMLVAVGGAAINFNLIALPMSEMVGGGSYIGPYQTSHVAALVIILVEAAMGLFLMESLRITRLFPVIGSMNDRMRVRMVWFCFTILLLLAGVESALAFMRDRIAADMQALRQALAAGEAVTTGTSSLIPTVGQMVMGFILPFALTFVAIPLESFIHSCRTVLGTVLVGFLRSVALCLRLVGVFAQCTFRVLASLYDLAVFPMLWLEAKLAGLVRDRGKVPAEEAGR